MNGCSAHLLHIQASRVSSVSKFNVRVRLRLRLVQPDPGPATRRSTLPPLPTTRASSCPEHPFADSAALVAGLFQIPPPTPRHPGAVVRVCVGATDALQSGRCASSVPMRGALLRGAVQVHWLSLTGVGCRRAESMRQLSGRV